MVERRRILARVWRTYILASCDGEGEVAEGCCGRPVDAWAATRGCTGGLIGFLLGDGTISKSWGSCSEDMILIFYETDRLMEDD